MILDFGGNVKRHGLLDDRPMASGARRRAARAGPSKLAGKRVVQVVGNPVPAQTRLRQPGFKWPTPKPHESAADKEAAILFEEIKAR